MSAITTRVLSDFNDPAYGPALWEQLLPRGDTNVVFQTWHYLRAWWETLGEGQLLLVAAARDGQVIAIAPLYTTTGMVYFLGAGDADYHDFIGDTSDPDVLAALLAAARAATPEFLGFRLHHVLEHSRTGQRLQAAADRDGYKWFLEGELPAPEVDMIGQGEALRTTINRSMLKREEYFRKNGNLEVRRLRDVESIRDCLEEYFTQHVARWEVKTNSSPFRHAHQRRFFRALLDIATPAGWVRFLRLDWEGRPLAMEFAWYYRGTHYSAPWCFALEQAKRSPGHVLLRQSILAALDEGLTTYDLGGGDQEYKFRLPTRVKMCYSWGLYPA